MDQGEISAAKYSMLKPSPRPIQDAFRGAYAAIRKGIADGTITHLNAADFPSTVPDPPDRHIVAPDRLMQIDMKLRNNLLGLITSPGRRRHYQALTLSGYELLRIFTKDAQSLSFFRLCAKPTHPQAQSYVAGGQEGQND